MSDASRSVSERERVEGGSAGGAGRIVRHGLADRVFHWVAAVCVLVLLGTAFLPILGWQFAWVQAHWITGFVLTAAVLFHVVRSLIWQSPRSMWIGRADFTELGATLRGALRPRHAARVRTGKYSLAQKLIHHAFTVVVLATIVTGMLMLAKIDSPLWQRNPYWLTDRTWGVVYVLHGLAALLLITMVMTHVYFALRPEKLHFMRSMIVGWITRREYLDYHDPERWQVDR